MDSRLEEIVKVLQQPAEGSVAEFRGEVRVTVPADQIVDTLIFLRDAHEFSLLSVLTAVDYWPQDRPRYVIVYQLTSLTQNLIMQVRVGLAAEAARLPTVTGVFETANWHERELFDMFGIEIHRPSRPAPDPDARRLGGPPAAQGLPAGLRGSRIHLQLRRNRRAKPYAKE